MLQFFQPAQMNNNKMADFCGYPFKYSDPADIGDFPLDNHYSILPLRVSKFLNIAIEPATSATKEWAEALGIESRDLAAYGGITSRGHAVSWLFPDLPPPLIPLMVRLYEFICYWDGRYNSFYHSPIKRRLVLILHCTDATDVLDKKSVSVVWIPHLLTFSSSTSVIRARYFYLAISNP